MELMFLGTSSGAPTRQRNVSGVAIKESSSKEWILVDCGEGTQHQILQTPLSLNSLQAICITHIHGDHCYGLPGLIASAGMHGRRDPLIIIAPKNIELWIQSLFEWTDLHLPYKLEFHDVTEFQGTDDVELHIERYELSHRVPSYAYGFQSQRFTNTLNRQQLIDDGIPPGPLWGQIQAGVKEVEYQGRRILSESYLLPQPKPRKIIIAGDNDQPRLLKAAVQDAQVLVHESTYTQEVADRVGPGPQHSSAQMVSEFAKNAEVENLILTHFSARFQDNPNKSPSIFDIENEAREHYSGNLYLANDFDHFELNKDFKLIKK